MGSIDLHTHSTVSDGTYTPTGLAQLARERGVRTFSLTDHDNVTGLDEAERAARAEGVELIPGIELTVNFEGRKLHVVALGLSGNIRHFRPFTGQFERVRKTRYRSLSPGFARKASILRRRKCRR